VAIAGEESDGAVAMRAAPIEDGGPASAPEPGPEIPAPHGRHPASAPRSLTIGLVLAVTVTALESLTVLSIMPIVAHDLDGFALYGWVFAGFFITSALAIPVAARVIDRSGLRRPFIFGLVLFGGGLLIAGLAPSMLVLVGGRVLQGVGAGTLNAVIYAAVAIAYPPRDRARILALISTAWLVPSFAGPLLGSLIASVAGWRWTFLLLAASVPIVAVLVLPAVTGHDQSRPRPVGPRTNVGILPPPAIARAAVLSMLAGLSIYGAIAFAPVGMTDVRGQSTFEAGLAVGVLSLAWVVAAWLNQRYMQRFEPRNAIRYGLLVMTLSLPIIGGAAIAGPPFGLILAGWVIVGLGAGVAFQAINLFVMARAEPGAEGRATSSVQLANTIGAAVGTSAMGGLLNAGQGAGLALGPALLLVLGACWLVMAISTVISWGMPRRSAFGGAVAAGAAVGSSTASTVGEA